MHASWQVPHLKHYIFTQALLLLLWSSGGLLGIMCQQVQARNGLSAAVEVVCSVRECSAVRASSRGGRVGVFEGCQSASPGVLGYLPT